MRSGRQLHRALSTLVLVGVLVGCDAAAGAPAEFSAERADWVSGFCGLDGGERVGAAGAPAWDARPAYPDTILQMEEGRIASIATSPGGRIALYSDHSSRVLGVDDSGVFVAFGRTGSGPGEFHGPPVLTQQDHVSMSDESFLVFDGVRLLEFDLDGRPLHSVPGGVFGLRPLANLGLRATSDAHYVGIMEWGFSSPDRALQFYRWSAGSLEPVGGVPLTPLVQLQSGAWAWRSFLPMPLWDVAGECAVVSDGESHLLEVLNLGSGERRWVEIRGHPLSDAELLRIQAAEQEKSLAFRRERGLPAGSEVEISRPRRWADLRHDRAGSLWLEPWVGPEDATIALRIPLAAWAPDPQLIEVPGLPAAFLSNGERLIIANPGAPYWTDLLLRLPPMDVRGAPGHGRPASNRHVE